MNVQHVFIYKCQKHCLFLISEETEIIMGQESDLRNWRKLFSSFFRHLSAVNNTRAWVYQYFLLEVHCL